MVQLSLADRERRATAQRLAAAMSIQRVYRGYRVRKAIKPLLARMRTRTYNTTEQDHILQPTPTTTRNNLFTTLNSPDVSYPSNPPSPPINPPYLQSAYTPPTNSDYVHTPPPTQKYGSYSPIASPPLQPDHMSIINIFTRGVLDGKYLVSMEENGLLSLSLNKPRMTEARAAKISDVIQTLNQDIEKHDTITMNGELTVPYPKGSSAYKTLDQVKTAAILQNHQSVLNELSPDGTGFSSFQTLTLFPTVSLVEPSIQRTGTIHTEREQYILPITPPEPTSFEPQQSPNSLWLQYDP